MSVKIEWNKQAMAQALDDQKVKEAVDEQTKKILSFANAPMTISEEPSFDTWREVRIEYLECLGDASKSFNLETFLTFDEMMQLCCALLGDNYERT